MISNRLSFLGIFLLSLFFLTGCNGPQKRSGDPKVLVFSKTEGFRHGNIEEAVKAVVALGERKGFQVKTSEDSDEFTEENLQQYSAIVFLNTTGDILNTHQEVAFERYIQAGGGFVGIHSATDTEYDWKWYGKLVGAYFKSHPKIQEADMIIHPDPKFPLLDSFPNLWTRTDEWYNFRKAPDHVNVIVSIDESSYEGGSNGDHHPMTWYHEFDGGRAFYMEMGHTEEAFHEPLFLDLLYAGIEYAIGDNLVLNYDQATSYFPPDENRFSKVELVRGLDEPTEMTILPDHSVLISERKGGLKYYHPETKETTTLAEFNVYHRTDVKGVNVEMGFMGIKADPDYANNHWVYVFYSPMDVSVDRLSRFKFQDGQWDMSSEQIILDVETDRDICCHTGGSIAFDKDGNLYVSTGDNTTPFNQKDPVTGKRYGINLHGYAPLDDREGYYNYDGRRGPGNTNDLRGKILRIKVQEDGSYTIPEGNLFPEGTEKTRPEIYVMGNRNPYRISVDQKNSFLYWGEVGPDARRDSLDTRGPMGYDEVNQARKAGNFGWPYFVGNNYAYWEYDYSTGESLFQYDPEKPINTSRNNTGLRELPPAQPAFIYYPYGVSKEFPILKSGGRNAMAGPVYYKDMYPEDNRLPDYFDGKLFIYDWIRNWIMVVTMDEESNLQRIDPFMPNTTFYNLIDMEMGPNGDIYILEYGTGWFTMNENSSLAILKYNPGNRAPIAELAIETKAGPVPFELNLDASHSVDPDGDPLTYSWFLNDELLETTQEPRLNHTIEKSGVHTIYVSLDDGNKGTAKSPMSTIVTGNSRPQVQIDLQGNRQFYFDNKPIQYTVQVEDKEDGSFKEGNLSPERLTVRTDYLESFDKAATTLGHQEFIDPALEAESIIAGNDCASCHKKEDKSVGPSYMDVALKYKNDPKAETYLIDKIKKGGSGVWGDVAMAAHPDINDSDVKKIVTWIQSMAVEESDIVMNSKTGRIVPSREFTLTDHGTIVINASYTDKGAPESNSLTGQSTLYLTRPVLYPKDAKNIQGATTGSTEDIDYLLIEGTEAQADLGSIDFTGISTMALTFAPVNDKRGVIELSLHVGSANGPVIATGHTPENRKPMQPSVIRWTLNQKDRKFQEDVWLVAKRPESSSPVALISIELEQ